MEVYKIGPTKLVTILLNVKEIDLDAGISSIEEQKIIIWTNFHNINSLFFIFTYNCIILYWAHVIYP